MFCRSTHHPFFYKVPFDLYMDALEEAFPEYLPEQLLCKAQCQVFLEGASHQVGKSMPTPRFTISGDSRVAFEEAYRLYRRRYDHLANSSKRLKLIDLAFQMEVEKIQAGKSLNYWYVRVFKAALRRLTL
jgi:exonuclease VII small subunit